jgi:hypothetical protein
MPAAVQMRPTPTLPDERPPDAALVSRRRYRVVAEGPGISRCCNIAFFAAWP